MKKIYTVILGGAALASPMVSLVHAQSDQPKDVKKAAIEKKAEEKKVVEVCFVLDTTGSMGGLIEGAKQKIWSIASKIAQRQDGPEIKFSLVAYRDRGDSYVTQLTDLDNDLDVIHAKLMTFRAAGGGDTPESVNQALNEAVHKIKWSKEKNVSKLIFLVGDAPPHMDYEQDVDYTVSCASAGKKGIIINTVQCGKLAQTTQTWQHIAKLGGGEFVSIPQAGGVNIVKCPQDVKIAELTRKLNGTVIPYGDKKRRAQAGWKVRNANLQLEADSTLNATRASCLSAHKGSYKAFLGDNDLVAEWGDKKVTLKNLKRENLPESLKKLGDEALVLKIATQIKLRTGIQKEMNILLKQRSEFLLTESKKKPDGKMEKGFDAEVEQLLKKQIK